MAEFVDPPREAFSRIQATAHVSRVRTTFLLLRLLAQTAAYFKRSWPSADQWRRSTMRRFDWNSMEMRFAAQSHRLPPLSGRHATST